MVSNDRTPMQSLLEDNLKKAMTELLILYLLSQKDYYIGELTADLHTRSGGILNIVFPYSAIYRLDQSGYIREIGKRIAPDGRRRQYIQITESGRSYLVHLLEIYHRFNSGVSKIIDQGVQTNHESCR